MPTCVYRKSYFTEYTRSMMHDMHMDTVMVHGESALKPWAEAQQRRSTRPQT